MNLPENLTREAVAKWLAYIGTQHSNPNLAWRMRADAVLALVAERDALALNVTGLRAKNHALNLRAQQAEGIIAKSGIVEGRYQGPENRSLGRALANYAAAQEFRRAEAAEARNAALVALLGECLTLIRDRDRVPVIFDDDLHLLTSRLDAAIAAGVADLKPGGGAGKGGGDA